jgi:hypothetical protein
MAGAEIAGDYFPVAVGNWWRFKTNTGNEIWTISAKSASAFTLTRDYNNGSVTTLDLVPYDDSASFNRPAGRELGAIWGPNFALPNHADFTTSLGTFDSVHHYRIVWGHPSGGNRNGMNAPGVGPLALIWASNFGDAEDIVYGTLESYHQETVPHGTKHDQDTVFDDGPDNYFQCKRSGNNGCELTFRIPSDAKARYSATVSFNEITNCIRIYCHNGSAQAGARDRWDHRVLLASMNPSTLYRIKIYEVWYETTVLKSDLKYDRSISLNQVSIARQPQAGFPAGWNAVPVGTRSIRFSIPSSEAAALAPDQWSVTIVDLSGSTIRVLPVSGQAEVVWDVRNHAGARIPSGVYLYSQTFGRHCVTGRIIVGE